MFNAIGRSVSVPVRVLVSAIVRALDGLNGRVSRIYDRFDDHFSARTKLLRTRYARRTDLKANPPPTLGGVADRAVLLTGNDTKAAA